MNYILWQPKQIFQKLYSMQIKPVLILGWLMKVTYWLQWTQLKKKAILQYYSEQTKLAWPPTPEQFSTSERNIPKSGHLFLTELFKSEKHSVTRSRNITRVVEPYAAILVHGVSRGKLMTSKHFLLGLGIHNVTGLFDQII